MRFDALKIAVFCCCLLAGVLVHAQEPGWYGRVVLPEAERQVIEATPILQRPYRPLHFYGNTVRRQYYRGRSLPGLRDLGTGATVWVLRR